MEKMQVFGNDIGIEILPVHRLKLRWLLHRWVCLPVNQRRIVTMIEQEWTEWGGKVSTPHAMMLLDKVYNRAKQIKKELGI